MSLKKYYFCRIKVAIWKKWSKEKESETIDLVNDIGVKATFTASFSHLDSANLSMANRFRKANETMRKTPEIAACAELTLKSLS